MKAKIFIAYAGKFLSIALMVVAIIALIPVIGFSGYEIATHIESGRLVMSDSTRLLLLEGMCGASCILLVGALGLLGTDNIIVKLRLLSI